MNTLSKAVKIALAGSVVAIGAFSNANASITMYNTFISADYTGANSSTDGWTHTNGSGNSGPLQPWVGIPGSSYRPFGFQGPSALSWAIQLTSAGDSGTISKADSVARYGFAPEIDTAQGAWQDNTANIQGWRHQVDFGLIKSDVTQTIRLTASTDNNEFPSLFGISLYKGMDNRIGGGWSHHGSWNAGYVAGDTSATNLAKVNSNNPMDITGLTFVTFIDSSGLGPYGSNTLEFTAQAGQIYTVMLGGRAGGGWNGVKADYSLSVASVPVPGAVWLFGSAVAGLSAMRRKKAAA